MRRGWMLVACVLASSAFGCATGQATDEEDAGSPTDGGTSPKDGGKSDGSNGCPTGKAGTNCASCASGYHACGTDCRPDLGNDPKNGCTQGCGAACTAPTHSTAKCTSQGTCDFTCDQGYTPSGGGDGGAGSCACPTGQVDCNGTCKQCCTASDCPANVQCTNGTCTDCLTDWGDCNANMTDGCETKLDSKSNCGACGKKCCGSVCGCGFLGLGGESCNVSGNTHKCGC